MRLILRDYDRTPHDDFVLHVQPHLNENEQTIPITKDGIDSDAKPDEIIAWQIEVSYS